MTTAKTQILTFKCGVRFEGWRTSDLTGKDGLYRRLRRTQQDCLHLLNCLTQTAFFLDRGLLAWPMKERNRKAKEGEAGDEKGQVTETVQVPLQTLLYRTATGAWIPRDLRGKPLFRKIPYDSRQTWALSAGCLSAQATYALQRYKADQALKRGHNRPPFSHFTRATIRFRASEVSVTKDGRVDLKIYRDPNKARRSWTLTVAPSRLRGNGQTIWDRIVSGEYAPRTVELYQDRRSKKWMMSIAYQYEVTPAPKPITAGLHTTMRTAFTLAWIDDETGDYRGATEVEHSMAARRAARKVRRRRQAIGRSGRKELGRRAGRGVTRKLRPLQKVQHKQRNIINTSAKQAAAGVAAWLEKLAIRRVVLPDLSGLDDRFHDEVARADIPQAEQRRRRRQRKEAWPQYLLQEKATLAARKRGVEVYKASPAFAKCTCSRCGVVWTFTAPDKVREYLTGATVGRAGSSKVVRVFADQEIEAMKIVKPYRAEGEEVRYGPSYERFYCSCGLEVPRDRNTATNLARRAP